MADMKVEALRISGQSIWLSGPMDIWLHADLIQSFTKPSKRIVNVFLSFINVLLRRIHIACKTKENILRGVPVLDAFLRLLQGVKEGVERILYAWSLSLP